MLALAALAALSAVPLFPLAQRTELPPGCLARFGNPLAESRAFSPSVSANGRFLFAHRALVIDTVTGEKHHLRDKQGYGLDLKGERITDAGYFVLPDEWDRDERLGDGLPRAVTWRFAVLDYATSRPKQTFDVKEEGEKSLREIHPTPDGRSVVARWWDGREQKAFVAIHPPNATAFQVPLGATSPDAILLSPNGERVAFSFKMGKVWHLDLCEVATGKRMFRAALANGAGIGSLQLAFSPDGKRVALRSLATGVVMFDASGRRLWQAPIWNKYLSDFSFSPDGATLSGVTPQCQRRQWNADTGKEGERTTLGRERASRVVISGNSLSAVETREGEPLRVIDRRTGRVRFELPRSPAVFRLRAGDGVADIQTEDGILHSWNWRAGKSRKVGDARGDWRKWEEVFEPQAERYQVRYADTEIVLFDTTAKKPIPIRYTREDAGSFDLRQGPTVGPTGLVAASGTLTDPQERPREAFVVADPKTGRHVVAYDLPQRLDGITWWFHPNGREVWLGLGELGGSYLGPSEYVKGVVVLDLMTGTPKRTITFPTGVASFAGDRTGRLIALNSPLDGVRGVGVVRVLDTRTGKVVLNHARGALVAFSPDGRWLLTSERRLYDTTRPDREAFVLPVPELWRALAAFSPDGRQLLTGHENGCVHVWDLARIGAVISAHPKRTEEMTARSWEQLRSTRADVWEQALLELCEHPEEVVRRAKEIPVVPAAEMKAIRAAFAEVRAGRGAEASDAEARLRRWCDEGSRDLVAAVLKTTNPEDLTALLDDGEDLRRYVAGTPEDGPPSSPNDIARIRAVELMERLGTPEAKAVLKAWAGGAPNARLTTEAKAALERLGK